MKAWLRGSPNWCNEMVPAVEAISTCKADRYLGDRLDLVGRGLERDRRPTQAGLDRIIAHLDANERQEIPVGRIIHFAVATAM